MDAKMIVSLLIEKLLDLLFDREAIRSSDREAKTNRLFDKEVHTTIDSLHSLKQFLKDSEDLEASCDDQTVARLLKAVYSADDAADIFLMRKRGAMSSFKSLCIHTVFIYELRKFKNEVRRLVEKQENSVTLDIEDVAEHNSKTRLLDFQNHSRQLRSWGRISGFCPGEETDDVVGLEQHVNELLIRLIPEQDQHQDQQLTQVIAVIGEGGSGKTTLARNVYNRVEVKRHFTNRAWVRVPSSFSSRHVLADILRQVDEAEVVVEATLSEDELMERLSRLLNNGAARYLIVLENVETPQVCKTVVSPLCSSSRFGGRIIICTCSTDNLPPPEGVYSAVQLCRLNEEESWKLFSKKVRITEDELNNTKLITLKEQIMNACGGLPSLIVLLGSLLSTKEVSYEEWSEVLTNLANKKKAVGFFNTSMEAPNFGVRRLAAYIGVPPSFLLIRNLRSYVAFDCRIRGGADKGIGMLLYKIVNNRSFGLLNVLDLEGVYQPMLSDNIVGKLLILRQLGLRSTFIEYFPTAVLHLPCLEILDVKHTNIKTEPRSWQPKKLRHLYSNQSFFDRIALDEVSYANLLTLEGLYIVDIHRLYLLNWLPSWTSLRKLKLTIGVAMALDKLAEGISRLTNLQSLKMKSISEQSSGEASCIKLWTLAEHHKLWQLYLLGILSSHVIDVHFLPPYLRKLTLSMSRLSNDPMPVLGQLPHLNILRLYSNSYMGTRINCVSGGFPNLRLLKLWKLQVQEWTVEEGALPCLTELEIRDCYNLKPPEGLRNLTTLKEVVLTNMSMDFRAAVERILGGRNVYIKHIRRCSSPLLVSPLIL
ncbi:hypothetical protein JRO89_XS09G0235800 [Xanthoceras sorbifolium]|uniref:Uncharacterized protein n=1 Tax=Xanthoceras sorbifolium TaxID=99658 RepID=A0ABQ8HMN7_9ROSI|nr:hypothetical protein JRO89_XS09G0235800 [Xanthoceras sorbifolium]